MGGAILNYGALTLDHATVVPSQAVQTGPEGQYVYVVKPDQTVEMRAIKIARAEGDLDARQLLDRAQDRAGVGIDDQCLRRRLHLEGEPLAGPPERIVLESLASRTAAPAR